MKKTYITADEQLLDSFKLSAQIVKSGYHPDYIVAIWRGGTPIGIAVQEFLAWMDLPSDHISIRTSSYTGMQASKRKIRVHGLEYLTHNLNADDKLLFVDDVYDTGRSIEAVIKKLKRRLRKNLPTDIRIAALWYKPSNNQTKRVPDFFINETSGWVVFPHSLEVLSRQEAIEHKPGLEAILNDYQGAQPK